MNKPPKPCIPKSECWCEQNPDNPHCPQGVPIDNSLFIAVTLILGIVYVRIALKTNKK